MKKLLLVLAIIFYNSTAYSCYSDRDKICMAKAIYWEARGEIDIGKLAVASVILTRLKDEQFPNSICGVVYERKGRRTQFSPHVVKNSKIEDKESWLAIKKLSEDVLAGKDGLHHSFTARYFHSKNVRPNWQHKQRVAIVGNHIFYY